MKVLVLYEEIPESSRLLLIDMTPEEYQELVVAHGHYIGCYAGSSTMGDPVNQALCKWNFAIHSVTYNEVPELDESDAAWMAEEGVDVSWHNRFAGRITVLEHTNTASSFDAFINTGLAM